MVFVGKISFEDFPRITAVFVQTCEAGNDLDNFTKIKLNNWLLILF